MPISKIQANSLAANAVASGSGKNLIINGAMQVAQRGTSFTGVTGTQFGVDRFNYFLSNSGTFTVEQSTDAPDGFSNSIKLSCTVADASLASSDYDIFQQRIEGQNLQHLKYGTSNAEKVTLSFWVKSNLTGNFIAEISANATAPYNPIQYSINSANTWEYKTLTYTGLTTSTIDNDNTNGLEVSFWLAAGSNYSGGTHTDDTWHSTNANRAAGLNQNLSGSTSNTWQVTGVQLEIGDTATDFEHKSYGEELALCQRYYQILTLLNTNYSAAIAYTGGSNAVLPNTNFSTMRAAPTVTFDSSGNIEYYSGSAWTDTTVSAQDTTDNYTVIVASGAGPSGVTRGSLIRVDQGTSMNALLDAEL